MKKTFSLLFLLMLLLGSFFAVGCKKKPKDGDPTKVELVVEFSDPAKTTLKIGETAQLSYTVTSESTVTAEYESSDSSIASVSNTGLVTAAKAGSATIKITITDSEGAKKEKSYTFTVEAKTFTVTLELDGGTVDGGKTSITGNEGTEVTLPTPKKNGYDFLGWKLENGKTYITKVTLTKDVKVFASYQKQVTYFTVTYNLDGGSLSETTAQVAEGSNYTLKTPTRDGFVFLGYTLTEAGTEYILKLENVSADTTVYAHWEATCKITYNLDGATYNGKTSVTKGETLKLGFPVKENYVFLGWSLGTAGTSYISEVENIQADTTLVANWKSLSDALAETAEGGTLILGPGKYTGLTIDKSLTLLGANAKQNPNIGPRTEESTFTGDIIINASNVTIKGIMLTGAGRIKAGEEDLENITLENIYVYAATLNVGNISVNAPFYFVAAVGKTITNLTIKNSRIDNDPSIGNDRPMIMYYRDVENLTVEGNVFNGRQTQFNDGMKVENTDAAFGVKGDINIVNNTFAHYQQYVIWMKKFGPGTYNIKNNNFEDIGITTTSHGMATFVTYAGTESDEITIDMSYNKMDGSMILLRIDANNKLQSNAKITANYNIVTELKGDFFIKNANASAIVDASYNYFDGNTGDASKMTNSTYNNLYTDATEVPLIGDADEAANTYTVTFNLDGGEWFIEPDAFTYVYGYAYEFGIAEKVGFEFVHWVDENGQIYEAIPSSMHENLSLKAVWAPSIAPTAFEITNLPDEGIERLAELQLMWKFTPADTYNQGLEFTSSKEDIFTVDANGLIKAISDGTATLTVKVLADETLSKTYEIKVYSPARVTIEATGSPVLEIGKSLTIEATVEGDASGDLIYMSSDDSIATIDDNGCIKAVKAGTAIISAKIEGTNISNSLTVNVKDSASLDEVTKYVMSIMNATAITTGAYDYDDDGKEYFYQMSRGASAFLFEDLAINNTYARTFGSDHDFVDGVHYICIHDTGNMRAGATAKANAEYFMTADTSIHYVTGNDGIYKGVGHSQRAGHAGDGTDRYYALEETGVPVSEGTPVITMINGNFAINGVETTCRPYTDHEGTVKTTTNYTTKDITYSGIRCVAKDGYYYLGKTYFNDTYKLISNFGGNAASIGIESAVNEGSDYYFTMQRTAKLVATLLDEFNLTIDDVKMHNFFSGKNCAQVMKNNNRYKLDYRQDGWKYEETLWGEFLELVEIESKMYEYSKNYSFQFESYNTKLLDNTGRVVKNNPTQTEVKYKVTITNNSTNAETSFEGSVLIPSIYELGK